MGIATSGETEAVPSKDCLARFFVFFFFFWWVEKPSPQPLLPGSLPPPPPPTLQRFSTERDVYVPVSPCHTQESISSAWLASSGVPPPELNAQPCKDRDPLVREREPPGVPEACENGRTEASRSPPAPACLAAAHFHRICGLRLWRVTHLPPLLSLSKCQVTLAIPSPSAAPPPFLVVLFTPAGSISVQGENRNPFRSN